MWNDREALNEALRLLYQKTSRHQDADMLFSGFAFQLLLGGDGRSADTRYLDLFEQQRPAWLFLL
jgi:hypothetical protein